MSHLWTKAELNKVIGGSVETAIHKLVNNPKLPEELSEILTDYTFTKNNIGCSSAGVYHCQNSSGSLYLKIEKSNNEFRREFEIMKWLDSKLPVPQIRYYGEHGEFSYLLMTEANGHMSCECPEDELCKPYETTVRLLAEGLLMLQSIDIVECPFENSLDTKLKDALYNIENNLVDLDDFEDGNNFDTPTKLYDWLIKNKPPEELCFTHGDYCLPNILISDYSVTGFIDLGRAGIADKWQDIALCVRSIGYNLRNCDGKDKYVDLLFEYLKFEPDWDKINYYILLDELF
jgi:kanamycin kinase/aminoglycoside 3'-phosphotransferase-3